MAWWNTHRDFKNSINKDINPDLASERKFPPFNVEKLTNLLDGGIENTRVRRRVEAAIHSDPVFSRENQYFLSSSERYERGIQKSIHLKKKMVQLGWMKDGPEIQWLNRVLAGDIGFNVHAVFVNCILELGTDEQIAKWIPLAQNYNIIGTYAQTELGHGTYLRGLETTATFDMSTQEFVINTPKVSAMKWWPGDLGRSATHALVLAQLYIKGKNYGMHPFLVQIRSLHNHSPLPGITVGDIGPKMGFEHIDNGYLILRNIRIPLQNMLSRYSQVLPDGRYVKQGSEKINYFSMILVRVSMIDNAVVNTLTKACVIAIRYSVVRRQSELKPGDTEAKILDYQTQQGKLLPQLAAVYAFHFIGPYLHDFYNRVHHEIKSGNFQSLPELHALAAGLKALLTEYSSAGVEVCRRACGGHGYSMLSGLPSLYSYVLAACTYEGENTVLYLQTARYLVKCFASGQSGQSLPQSVAYLTSELSRRCQARDRSDFLRTEIYLDAFKHRACRLIRGAATKLQAMVQSGVKQYEAWNSSSVELLEASMAHCQYIVVKVFVDAVEKLDSDPAIQKSLKHLCHLFALHWIRTNAGSFLHDEYISGNQLDMVTASYLDLLLLLRKEAVILVDAFDYTDEQLNSALGSYDGQVYQRLFEWAQKAPVNHQVNSAYENYMKPLFHSALSKL
ncbi:peroxisomal acyl-coenzyme A oxidase 2 [Microcaecilia unicolor]|uniref:Acyl-coenzyme A oxidase n=1 Tax=Microcaecilia unicolor TaxID=1415580 RepID=A0A6P7YBU8_9AMPH|nr:peroxisomal acyl-coenzyme A oxidase 2 [Microcaecilia unicolor]XP_030062523.1 peroxisomal acyl-coenzyme A oxidase 2 [Microcaecilia unicolor]